MEQEQNHTKVLKRRLRRRRIAAIVLLLFVGGIFFEGFFEDWLEENSPHIARIEITGIIENDLARNQRFQEVANNSHIKAVILHLNTPGGTVVGGESLYESIKAVRARKPVVVVMNDIATSAGYMVALGGHYIVAHNGTLTGSIGVLLQSVEVTDLAQKLGIAMDLVKSAPLKGSPSPFEKMTPEVRASMQSVIDNFYAIFVAMVMEERKMSKAQALQLADGKVYTGAQALDLKLVDAIGGEMKALEWLQKTKKMDVSLPLRNINLAQKTSKIDEILHQLGLNTHFEPLERISLQGLVSIW